MDVQMCMQSVAVVEDVDVNTIYCACGVHENK